MLVSMLPRWQKPEGIFMAPTYSIGGSDSSHTRQGGILITFITLQLTMVFALLANVPCEDRGNRGFGSASAGFAYRSLQLSFASENGFLGAKGPA
jgi:hypothetical protein